MNVSLNSPLVYGESIHGGNPMIGSLDRLRTNYPMRTGLELRRSVIV